MREREIKIIERFKAIVSQRVKVHKVRAFGSRARGNATEEKSDLDKIKVRLLGK